MTMEAAVAYIGTQLEKPYKLGALTGDLTVNPAWVREGDNAGEFKLPVVTMPGLGDVVGGIMPVGAVAQSWQTYSYANKRGRTLQTVVTDRDEAARVAQIAMLSRQFMEQHVIPETDAIRFAKFYAGAANKVAVDITDTASAIAATNAALVAIANSEAPVGRCIGFATPDVLDLLDSAPSTALKSRFMTRLAKVVEVPTGRWAQTVTKNAGATPDAGGFTLSGNAIDFMVVDPEAVFADTKHTVNRFFPAEINQTGDLDRWDYYAYHDAWVRALMTAGVYVGYHATDDTPPTLTSVTPADDATGVAKASSTHVVWLFSEAIEPTDVTDEHFGVEADDGGWVAGTLALSNAGRTVTFTPDAAWDALTQYHPTAVGVHDLAGNVIATGSATNFTTGA